jgi:hypothetical protein
MLKELQFEMGILRSELAESQDKLIQYEKGSGQNRRLWLKDDLIKEMNQKIIILEGKISGNKNTIDSLLRKCASLEMEKKGL